MSKVAWVVSFATVTAIGLAAWLTRGWGGEATVRVVDVVGLLSFAVFSAFCAVLAARSAQGRQRIAWICLTFGLLGWAAGDALSGYYELVLEQEIPFPSLADAGYLMFPFGACLAL